MISLVDKRPAEPEAFERAVKKLRATIVARMESPEPLTDTDFVDGWSKWKHVLAKAQDGKCAYCERHVGMKSDAVIDHFRPKTCVQALVGGDRDDTRGKPPGRTKSGPKEPGYAWDAYAWSNYLVTCHDCNEVWKQCQFPIRGKRATCEAEEEQEAPLLLNPFDQDPSRHFTYDPMDGLVRGGTDEGTTTVDVCGLDRKILNGQRAIKASKIAELVDQYCKVVELGSTKLAQSMLRTILAECADHVPFAGIARWYVEDCFGVTYETLRDAELRGEL